MEKVPLHTITEKSLLHQLMRDKGFVLKSPQEIAALKERSLEQNSSVLSSWTTKLDAVLGTKEAVRKRRMEDEKEYDYLLGEMRPSYRSMLGLYGIALIAVSALVARRRRFKRKFGR